MNNIIGKIVCGIIDRPLGSHHPDFPDLIYELNYGYVSGIFAPDREEQDVYIIDCDVPIREFEGTVIAIYHRIDDIEDKWIVSLTEKDFNDDEILEKIRFQEKYFKGILYR